MAIGRLAIVFALLSAFAVANAQLEVKAWFPDHPTALQMEFVPGKLASCILGVRNPGSQTYNVTGPTANLAMTHMPDLNVFNFTRMPFRGSSLGPQEEINFEFPLFFPVNMPPRDFLLQMGMVFSQDGMYFHQSFYNQTITVVKPNTLIDVELIGLYLIGLVILGASGYGVHEMAKSKGWVKKKKKTGTTGTVSAQEPGQWLQGTTADPRKAKKQI